MIRVVKFSKFSFFVAVSIFFFFLIGKAYDHQYEKKLQSAKNFIVELFTEENLMFEYKFAMAL